MARTTSKWDTFKEEDDERMLSEDGLLLWEKVYRLAKIVFSIILGVLVFSSAIVAKGCLLILAWNVFSSHQPYHNGLKTLSGLFSFNGNNTGKILAIEDTETDIHYIWALCTIIVTPNVCTVIFCIWRLVFKKKVPIKWIPLLLTLVPEMVHSVGLSFFVFSLLPSMDPISGLFFCSFVTVIPSLMQMISALCLCIGKGKTSRTNKVDASKQEIKDETCSTDEKTHVVDISSSHSFGASEQEMEDETSSTEEKTHVVCDNLDASKQEMKDKTSQEDRKNVVLQGSSQNSEAEKNDKTSSTEEQPGKGLKKPFPHQKRKSNITLILSILALFFGVAALVSWFVYVILSSDPPIRKRRLWLYLFSPIVVSLGWWETFLPYNKPEQSHKKDKDSNGSNSSPNQTNDKNKQRCKDKWWCIYLNPKDRARNSSFMKEIIELRFNMHEGRYRINAIVNFAKIVVTFCMVIIIYTANTSCQENLACIKVLLGIQESPAHMNSAVFGKTWLYIGKNCSRSLPYVIALVGIISSIICQRFSVSAIKILTNKLIFCLPLVLVTPASCIALVVIAYLMNGWSNMCIMPFPWIERSVLNYGVSMVIACIASYVSFILTTIYVWRIKTKRMEKEDRIFLKPLYCGPFLEQSLMLNRITNRMTMTSNEETGSENTGNKKAGIKDKSESDPFIYICATMWHETEKEMTTLLKSIFRLDFDQCAHKLYSEGKVNDTSYYSFETHVIFDDAFESGCRNQYVETFIKCFYQTAKRSYPRKIRINDHMPVLKTPYGEQLIWKLPGENKLYLHLKDKLKIRRKKRWSQIMYMYYILSYKLKNVVRDGKSIKEIAKKRYILALDGDVDFRPSAVKLLVDRLRTNKSVGAACGRIHPTGIGPMVWYQKFEYAISHWLVKSAEHVTGCVLCSPGCFSLFRGSALMDCNVLKRYTKVSTEALDYIQHDQGEDRWLCTLLLKEGYKIEYCAASDAFTFAPEGFKEFYNQRRRWTPSTMANILDLFSNWKKTVKNDHISIPYLALQFFWFVSSILTPGVLLLMVIGAIHLAYPALSLHATLLINLGPVVLFIFACFFAKTNTQLNFAIALSALYALVMMIVLVGLLRQAVEEGFCTITTPFMLIVCGIFIIAGLSHPWEIGCLIHGLLYFIGLPAMSMLLMIYSIINLNNISWGTREAPTSKIETGLDNERKKKKNFVQRLYYRVRLSCKCCQLGNDGSTREEVDKHKEIMSKLESLELGITERKEEREKRRIGKIEVPSKVQGSSMTQDRDLDAVSEGIDEEDAFWKWLIEEFLQPVGNPGRKEMTNGNSSTSENITTAKHQEKYQKKQLRNLRNKASMVFLLLNSLFITVIFYLQQSNEDTNGKISISVPVQCNDGGRVNIDPISMAFTAVFGVLLVIQFVCMLIHRYKTFLQINSITLIWDRDQKMLLSEEFFKKCIDRQLEEDRKQDEDGNCSAQKGLQVDSKENDRNQDADDDVATKKVPRIPIQEAEKLKREAAEKIHQRKCETKSLYDVLKEKYNEFLKDANKILKTRGDKEEENGDYSASDETKVQKIEPKATKRAHKRLQQASQKKSGDFPDHSLPNQVFSINETNGI